MWVDGEGGDVPEVFSLLVVLLGYRRVYLVGSVFHCLRIFVWQTVLSEYGIHLHIVVAGLAEHVNHFAYHALVLLGWPLGDLHHCLVVGLSALQLALGDYDVVYENIAV